MPTNALIETLDNITAIDIPQLFDGYSETIGEFYDTVIEPMLPSICIVQSWQSLLYAYTDDPDAVFFLRKYQSAPRKDWNAIRRGFVTEYDKGGYVCCDNFFAHYIFALAIGGIVPTIDQFRDSILSHRFPYGFMSTKEERELQAFVKGKAPQINSSGWKLAHLVPVNSKYRSFKDSSFVDSHFPRGGRNEWTLTSQGYHARLINRQMTLEERSYLASHFIRLASPINYFLVPKQANERDAFGNNIGENKHVLEYVALQFKLRYGDTLEAFARAADAPKSLITGRDTSGLPAKVTYRNNKHAFDSLPAELERPRTKNTARKQNGSRSSTSSISTDQLHEMARLYLEQGISFRNLERKVLGIDSQARGGGFVAKTALNDFGITAADKGMLARMSPEAAVKMSTGKLKEAISKLYNVL